MANIKTAISIEEPLFEEIDALATELEVSRSSLFTMAVREFIKKRKNQKLLEAINNAYDDSSDFAEKSIREKMKAKHLRSVKDQW